MNKNYNKKDIDNILFKNKEKLNKSIEKSIDETFKKFKIFKKER